MPWLIEDILLPVDPKSFRKKTTRTQKPVALIDDFPDPALNQPTKFELVIQGFIWPRNAAKELDEAMQNAETTDLPISVTDDLGVEDDWFSGLYSVSKADINKTKPMFTRFNGVDVEVYEYNISFVKYASLGLDESGEEGGGDSEGTGFLDLPDDLGFDENGDGEIDPEEIFNWLVNILSFGVIK